MAAITAVITAGVALAGLGMSVKQASDAEKARKQAESAADVAAKSIENLNTQNAYQNLAIPTMGTDLAQQALDRQNQANINALKGAGAEGVLGGAGTIAQSANEQELALAAQLNDLEFKKNIAVAGAQQDINVDKTERLNTLAQSRLQGAQANVAQQIANKNAAISGAFSSAGAALGHLYDPQTGLPLYRNAKMPTDGTASSGIPGSVTVPVANQVEQSFQGPYYSLSVPK
jgi:hypothetical protein